MAARDMLDDALDDLPSLAVALHRWAEAERAVIRANELPFEMNRKLPEVARELAAASAFLLAAIERTATETGGAA